jgi:probable phosphoglycerate mutase
VSGLVLHLLRHGETVPEEPWRFLGQREVPLSDTGRVQARWWRTVLADVPFQVAACSDLARCRETAEIVVQGRDLPLRVLPGLREIDLGPWDGLSKAEVQARFPGQFQARGADMAGFRPAGGESFQDLQERAWAALEPLLAGPGPVLVVGHAGVNRALLCKALGLPLQNLFRLGQDPGCRNILEWGPQGARLVLLNERPGTL